MCEALDLKDKFVPLPGATALPQTPHRGVDQTTTVPVVGSFFCVEDVPGVGSSIHLRSTTHPNNSFSKAQQADSSGTVSCRF
ncbi:hypothetical protein TNIN_348611 [Trichonephila inaurata madagascariensis]|uniref:Uncharacterized protein n=1 Tax=Trichonephila inaurata madagascariensis TaxID=2747483 RepID=A0A8X7CKL7_9ARAC|nr:hypothetical protein TNIN_348611 [Trichonephila inaurata madagascariensis]